MMSIYPAANNFRAPCAFAGGGFTLTEMLVVIGIMSWS